MCYAYMCDMMSSLNNLLLSPSISPMSSQIDLAGDLAPSSRSSDLADKDEVFLKVFASELKWCLVN